MKAVAWFWCDGSHHIPTSCSNTWHTGTGSGQSCTVALASGFCLCRQHTNAHKQCFDRVLQHTIFVSVQDFPWRQRGAGKEGEGEGGYVSVHQFETLLAEGMREYLGMDVKKPCIRVVNGSIYNMFAYIDVCFQSVPRNSRIPSVGGVPNFKNMLMRRSNILGGLPFGNSDMPISYIHAPVHGKRAHVNTTHL